VFVGFRLRLFTLADELGHVSLACRAMGVDRSTYYRWKHRVGRWGLEALNVRERRRPRMPNQIGPHLEQRIIACALGHPGYGPRRISAELVRAKGAASASPSTASGGSYAASASTRAAKRLALMARHRDPYERRPDPPPAERHIDATTPSEKVQLDRCFVGQLAGTRPHTNGCVERVQLTVLGECWRPAFARSLLPKSTALAQDLADSLNEYNYDRAHTGRLTQGRMLHAGLDLRGRR
jgi:hypothetical protein